MNRWAPAVFLSVLTFAAAAEAQSEPRPTTPEEHLERGLRYYTTQDYEAAISEFKTGYQLRPDAVFLYALGQAQRMSGDCRSAVVSYRSFLRSAPPRSQADLARGNIKRCEDAVGNEEPSSATAPAPTTSPQPLREATAAPTASSGPPPPPPPPRTRPDAAPLNAPFYTDALGDVLTGVGIAAVGAGVGGWFVARGHAAAANEATRYDVHDREVAAAKTTLGVAITLGAIGIACAAVGIVRYATRPHRAH